MSHNDPSGGLMKLVVLGGGAVGKTALTVQLTCHHFVEYYDPTVEDIYRRPMAVDDETVMLEILDTAGQEEYSALRSSYYREGDGFVIVYDVTSRTSFEEVLVFRDEILKVKDCEEYPMIVVGNKIDLSEKRQVTLAEGEELAKSFGSWAKHIETSAKLRSNVDETFESVVRIIRQEHAHNSKMAGLSDHRTKSKRRRLPCRVL